MAVDFLKLISSPDAAYGEGLKFFRGTGMLNETIIKVGKIAPDYPAVRFVDYMTLLNIDGEWKIVSQSFYAEQKTKQ